jgi:hypothetical protein
MIEVWRQLLTIHVPNAQGRCQACTRAALAFRRRGGRVARAGLLKLPPSVTPTGPADRLVEHGRAEAREKIKQVLVEYIAT